MLNSNDEQELPKVIKLPPQEEVISRLQGVYSSPYLYGMYESIGKSIGDDEINGFAVSMELYTALHEFLNHHPNLPPMVGALLKRTLPSFAEALIDDPEVKKDALDLFKESGWE